MPSKRRPRGGTPKNTSAVAAYIRVSTDEQATHGLSLEAQESALRSYCDMRGLELVELLRDPGVSAGKPLASREAGHRLLDLVQEGKVGSVVALKLDRLFRNTIDALTIAKAWDGDGVALHFVDMGGQSVDTSTALGQYIFTMLAGAAEMERNLTRERTKAALATKKAKGERVGRIPLGQRLAADGKHLEQDPAEQDTISLVKRLHDEGWTQKQIADHLNAQGKRARGRRNGAVPWKQSTVSRLLRRVAS